MGLEEEEEDVPHMMKQLANARIRDERQTLDSKFILASYPSIKAMSDVLVISFKRHRSACPVSL